MTLRREGVTCLEVKSGYGLDVPNERKMLQVAEDVAKTSGLRVIKTFLGAHALPPEFAGRGDEYIDKVVGLILPTLANEGLVDCVDAFCEKPPVGFSREQTSKVFSASQRLGIPLRLHGDQLRDGGGAALASSFSALSCDHCEYTSAAGAEAMGKAGCIAVLLPPANFFLSESQIPPIEKFRKANVRMAVATNCNPGSSPCCSILLTMNMGCVRFKMTPEEVLLGTTLHAAAAMGLESERGAIKPGE